MGLALAVVLAAVAVLTVEVAEAAAGVAAGRSKIPQWEMD